MAPPHCAKICKHSSFLIIHPFYVLKWLCIGRNTTPPPSPLGQDLFIHEVFQITHNDAPQSVGILWTSDQLVAEMST